MVKNKNQFGYTILALLIAAMLCFSSCTGTKNNTDSKEQTGNDSQTENGESNDPNVDGDGSGIETNTDYAGSNVSGGGVNSDGSKIPGTASGNSRSGTTSNASSKNPPAGTVLDMEGYQFVIGTAYYSNYKNSSGVLDPNHPLMKAAAKVEKDYNCKIKFLSFPSVSGAATQIINTVMSGEKLCDVAQIQFSRTRFVAKAKASHDLNTLPGLDLKNGNFSDPMTFASTFNGKTYAVDFGGTGNVQGLFYNKSLLKTYAPGYNIDDMYNKGTWTEANFETMLRQIKAAGKIGLTGDTGILALTSAANAGGTTYKENNSVKFGIVTEDGVVGLNYVKKLYNDQLWVRGANFNSGGAVFVDGAVWMNKNYPDVDMGFVPWPKGLKNKHIIPMGDGPAWCVPSTVKKKDYVGTIINALSTSAAEMQNSLMKSYSDAGFDKASIDRIKWAQNNHSVDMTSGPEDLGKYSPIIDNSVFDKNTEPASAMQSIRAAAQQIYDDYYKTLGK